MRHKITCIQLLLYHYKTSNGVWVNYEKFDRVATDAEIIDLRKRGYKVVKHRIRVTKDTVKNV